MSRLWRDDDGGPWVAIFDFTMIAGRLQCVGLELRSFLRDEVDPGDGAYSAYWEGEPVSYVKMVERAEPNIYSEQDLAGLRPEFRPDCRGEKHPLLEHDSLGAETDASASPQMVPRPLLATILRQLPLADVVARTRQDAAELNWDPPQEILDAGEAALDAWLASCEALWAPKRRPDGRVAKYSHEDLEHVAAIYARACELGSTSPTKDVGQAIGVNRNQAAKLVMKCRRAGLIQPVSNRQRPTRRRSNYEQEGDNHANQDH